MFTELGLFLEVFALISTRPVPSWGVLLKHSSEPSMVATWVPSLLIFSACLQGSSALHWSHVEVHTFTWVNIHLFSDCENDHSWPYRALDKHTCTCKWFWEVFRDSYSYLTRETIGPKGYMNCPRKGDKCEELLDPILISNILEYPKSGVLFLTLKSKFSSWVN